MSKEWGWAVSQTSPTSVVLYRVFDDRGNRGRVGTFFFSVNPRGWKFIPNTFGAKTSRKYHSSVLKAAEARMLPKGALDAIRALETANG